MNPLKALFVVLIASLGILSCKPRHANTAEATANKDSVVSAFIASGALVDFLQNLDEFKNHNYLSIEDEVDCDGLARICTLRKLEYLSIAQNTCLDFPPDFKNLKDLQRLDLGLGVNGSVIPSAVLSAKGLKQIEIHGFEFEELPLEIRNLTQLQILGLTATSVNHIPKEVALMPSLKEIYLPLNDSTEVLMARLKGWNPKLLLVAD